MQHPTAKIWGFPVPAPSPGAPPSREPKPEREDPAAGAATEESVPYLGIDTPTHTPRCTTPLHGGAHLLGRAVGASWSVPLTQPSRFSRLPEKPSPRFGHTAVALPRQDKMLVFGGRCNEEVFNDLWLLSVAEVGREVPGESDRSRQHNSPSWGSSHAQSTWDSSEIAPKAFAATWEPIITAPDTAAPIARAGHTAVMCSDNRMLVFAGGDARTSFLADVWALDTDTIDWCLLSSPAEQWRTYSPVSPAPSLPTTEDIFPHGRKGHTAVFDPITQEMLVFGGLLSAHRPKTDNNLWAFSTETNKWRIRPAYGSVPSSCMYHVAELDIGNRSMYIFGGRLLQPNSEHPFLGDLYRYDLQQEFWRKIDVAPSPFVPSPRMCSASLLFNGKLLLVHGGSATYMSDLYEFDLRTHEWRALPSVATPRTRPTLCRVNNKIFLFGGCFQSTYHNDLHVTELRAPTLSNLCHEWIKQVSPNTSEASALVPPDVLEILARRSLPSDNG